MTRFIAAALLSLTLLAGCSSDNVSCGIDECKVTFDRGVSASASVLGVEAKLVSAEGDNVTLEVAGEQITLTTGQTGTEVAGLMVYLDQVTDSQVVVRIARN